MARVNEGTHSYYLPHTRAYKRIESVYELNFSTIAEGCEY